MIKDEPDIRTVAELALEQIDECQPQLIVLDVMMPGMDGPATLKAIRLLPGYAETLADQIREIWNEACSIG